MDYETDSPVDDLEVAAEDDAMDLGDGWLRPQMTWNCPQP